MAQQDAGRYEILHKQGSHFLYELDLEVTHLSLRKKRKAVKLHPVKIANSLANCEIEVYSSFDTNAAFSYCRIQFSA